MYKLLLENEKGLSIDFMNEKDFVCVDIDGIGGNDATLNETENANYDGSIVNSGHINSRTIKLFIRITGNCGKAREDIYRVALLNKYCKLSLINDIRSVYIEGIIKNIDTPLFVKQQKMEISILCANPFFKDIEELVEEFSLYEKCLHFPYESDEYGHPFTIEHSTIQANIVNTGDSDTGCIFVFRANGYVKNPKLFNTDTNEYIKLNIEMQELDEIIINTNAGEKSVMLIRDNVEINIINKFDLTSTWLQMMAGNNKLSYICEEGQKRLDIYVRFTNKYLGV